MSAALTVAYGRELRAGLSAHLQADHWRTLATHGRSLWEGADIRESRLSAALVKRVWVRMNWPCRACGGPGCPDRWKCFREGLGSGPAIHAGAAADLDHSNL